MKNDVREGEKENYTSSRKTLPTSVKGKGATLASGTVKIHLQCADMANLKEGHKLFGLTQKKLTDSKDHSQDQPSKRSYFLKGGRLKPQTGVLLQCDRVWGPKLALSKLSTQKLCEYLSLKSASSGAHVYLPAV